MNSLDITPATAWAMVVAGFLTPLIVQFTKKHIPEGYTEVFAIGVAIVIGVAAVGATNGFAESTWGVAITGVVGVAQIVYALINKSLGNSMSKGSGSGPVDKPSENVQNDK